MTGSLCECRSYQPSMKRPPIIKGGAKQPPPTCPHCGRPAVMGIPPEPMEIMQGHVDSRSGERCAWANGREDCQVPDCKFSAEQCFCVKMGQHKGPTGQDYAAALERTDHALRAILAGKPLRDADEILAANAWLLFGDDPDA